MNYALIEDGKVINIISLHPLNLDDFPNAVPINDLSVQIGDDYKDGKFYHEGKELLPFPDIEKLKDQVIQEVQNAILNA